jgi:hypothetical protein
MDGVDVDGTEDGAWPWRRAAVVVGTVGLGAEVALVGDVQPARTAPSIVVATRNRAGRLTFTTLILTLGGSPEFPP